MSTAGDRARRVGVAARLLLKDLLRHPVTLLVLFVVPALFDAIVLVTTGHRNVEVTIAALVEEGATIHVPGTAPGLLDLGLSDNGSRTVDQPSLSLVFLGTAAVCFLSCFLAFNLVHKRKDVDARLVLAGYRAHEVLAAKLLVLGALVALLAVYETAIVRPWLSPRQVGRVAEGFFLRGLVYGTLGLLVGALTRHELAGIFSIVLLTNVDVGWLQNPIYYAASERRSIIESLPGHYPTQLALVGAFADFVPSGVIGRSLAWAGGVLALALVAFGLRIRPPAQDAPAESNARRYYAKVLVVAYLVWIVAFQLVGRYAQTLPTRDLTTAWDRAIPFVAAFVWPYEACYVFPFLALLVLYDWHRFNVAVLAIVFANVTAFAVYLLLPVAFPRPELGTTLADKIVGLEYASDFSPGANKLPSMHVAMSWIIACAMCGQRGGRLIGALIVMAAATISIAALFVKQHIVLDVATGVPWGLAAWSLAGNAYRRLVDDDTSAREGLAQMFERRRWAALLRPRPQRP